MLLPNTISLQQTLLPGRYYSRADSHETIVYGASGKAPPGSRRDRVPSRKKAPRPSGQGKENRTSTTISPDFVVRLDESPQDWITLQSLAYAGQTEDFQARLQGRPYRAVPMIRPPCQKKLTGFRLHTQQGTR
jgi:hypothetical protein